MFTGGVEDDIHRTICKNSNCTIGGAVVKSSLGHDSYILCPINEVENYKPANKLKDEVSMVTN